MERIKTLIPGLDKLIGGGIPKGQIALLVGTPGTGKSIFCAQILYKNALEGKKCLYLNLEQNDSRIQTQMQALGMDPKKAKNMKIFSVDADDIDLASYLFNELKQVQYDFICVDSLDSIATKPIQPLDLVMKYEGSVIPITSDSTNLNRLRLKLVFKALSKSKATVFVTSERIANQVGLTRDTISEFLCDSIFVLNNIDIGSTDYRTLRIEKLRNSDHFKDLIPFDIGPQGIAIRENELPKR